MKESFKGESRDKTKCAFFFFFYALVLHLFGSCFLIQTTPAGQACPQEPQVSLQPSLQSLFVNQSHHMSFDHLATQLSPSLSPSQPRLLRLKEKKNQTARQKGYYPKDSLTRPVAFQ